MSGKTTANNDITLPEGLTYNADKTVLKLTNSYKDFTLFLNKYRATTLDASGYTKFLSLTGSEAGEIVRTGIGGSSLRTAGGNDTIYLNNEMDGYIHGTKMYFDSDDGINTIYGMNYYHTLLFDQGVSSFGVDSNGAFFTSGKTKVILKNATNMRIRAGSEKNTSYYVFGEANKENTFYYDFNYSLNYVGSATKQNKLIVDACVSVDLRNTSKFKNINVVDGTNVQECGYSYVNNFTGGSRYAKLLGSEGCDDVLRAGTGGAWLQGNGGTDTYYGGKGKDTFVYGSYGKSYNLSHNVTLNSYTSGQDEIRYKAGAFKYGNVSGNDVILTMDKGRMTIKGAKGKALTLVDSKGKKTVQTFKAPLPKGISYNAAHTGLLVKAPYKGNLSASSYVSTVNTIDASQNANAVNIYGNGKNNIIKASKGGGIVSGGAGNDTLYGSAGKNIFVFGTNDGTDTVYNYDSKKDVVQFDNNDTNHIRYDILNGGKDMLLVTGKTRITLKSLPSTAVRYRIGAKGKEQVSSGMPSNKNLVYKNKDYTTLYAKSGYTGSENLNDYNLSLKNFDGRAVTKAIKVTGTSGNNVIRAGKGGSTIIGGAGNDTLYGGAGKDIFVFDSYGGSNTVYNYNSKNDVLQFANNNICFDFLNGGKDVLLVNGKTRVTLKNLPNTTMRYRVGAKGKVQVSNGMPSNKNLVYKNKKYTTLYATGGFGGGVNLNDYNLSLKNFDARATAKWVKVHGTSGNNVIYAGKGGSFLQGGAGNDTLYGGAGADEFYYANGDGNDVICSYDPNKDSIKIASGKISSWKRSGNDVVFSIGKGSITVKGAYGKMIKFFDAKGKRMDPAYKLITTSSANIVSSKNSISYLSQTQALVGNAAVNKTSAMVTSSSLILPVASTSQQQKTLKIK